MRILVIEDEAIIALCMGMALQEAGHEVVGPAAEMEKCLILAEERTPDLALVDINLDHGRDGIEIARALMERWSIMSLFVSAQDQQAHRNADAAIGCLNKPFASRSLVESVEVARTIRQGALPLRLPEGLDLFPNAARAFMDQDGHDL